MNLKVDGTAHLILMDGAKLTATGFGKQDEVDYNHAGIEVSAGNALTIYGQQLGTGELEAMATGGHNAAGIGASEWQTGGVVTINGGIVTATGSNNGAGIGSGYGGGVCDDSANQITINGGRVKATGDGPGAGLGGGYNQHGGALVINGGTIEAIAGWNGGFSLGDHSGLPAPLMSVTINGGSVKAETIQNAPTNAANEAVWCVTVDVGDRGSGIGDQAVEVEGLDGCGTRSVYPIGGKVYLYLPNGTHLFGIDDQWYAAVVNGAATEATKTHQPAVVTVTSVKQRWPWNGKVDVGYALANAVAGEYYSLVTAVTVGGATKAVTNEVGAVTNGTVTVDCAALFGTGVLAPASITMGVVAYSVPAVAPKWRLTGPFLVIDLGGEDGKGDFTSQIYETADDLPAGAWNLATGWADEYKTRYLVMRKVKAGVPYSCDPGASKYPISKTMTPQKDYWIGVHQVTAAQYDRVMNAGGSTSTDATAKNKISWNTIRGSKGVLEAPGGFMSALSSKTGLAGFDLPTEAQWEIAARAGSKTEYGSYVDANGEVQTATADALGVIAWYNVKVTSPQKVGQLRPNLWGLYDTTGNVREWCRDGWDSSFNRQDAETPAEGNSSGQRVHRGECFAGGADLCPLSRRSSSAATTETSSYYGFRLSRTCEPDAQGK